MNKKIKSDTRPLMVTIRCAVYNHEPYIRQCLDGFVMQKTNFRFEAIVHDDASTDKSVDIIKEYAEKYPDIIKPIYEIENQYSKHDGSLDRIMESHTYGKYVAICEGDDYWIDPMKLQKQVDILERNPKVMMVYGNYQTIDEHDNEIYRSRFEYLKRFSHSGDILPELMLTNFVLTCTTCIRHDVFSSDFCHMFSDKFDYCIFLAAAFMGECYYMKEIIAAYRKSLNSLTNSAATASMVTNNITNVHKYACLKYYELKIFKQKTLWSNFKIKFNIMQFAIHLHYRNIDSSFLKQLLCLDKQLYLFAFCAIIKKTVQITLKELKNKMITFFKSIFITK